MTSVPLLAHAFSLAHGLGAALTSLAVFYVAGLLLMPRRWQTSNRWPDSAVMGLALYVLVSWIAISSRHIPLVYVSFVFAGILWLLASLRLRWLHSTLSARARSSATRRWAADFSILYVLAYVLIRPAVGPEFLPLGPGDNLTLVTYARHARHLLEFGTANVDLAAFDYMRSPATAYVLAWQSLMFGRDPLEAAMPTVFMQAALFGMVAAQAARLIFGLSRRLSMAIACIAVCAPLFRSTLTMYSLAEIMAATTTLYLLGILGSVAFKRGTGVSAVVAAVGGVLLLFFVAPPWTGWVARIPDGVAGLVSRFSFVALLGSPSSAQATSPALGPVDFATAFALASVPLFWAGLMYAADRWMRPAHIVLSDSDRRLAGALVVYAGAALIVGNVAVQAVRNPDAVRRPGSWRQLNEVGDLSFRSVTLKVAEETNGLSAALAMYYMPGRKTEVFGRGVSPQDLSFDSVSKEQPMFIQNFGCAGVGHADAITVPRVGCVLMAPPSVTTGTSYPFNQTFLFLNYDRMTPREPGGRWNTRPTLHLRVTADPQRAALDRDLFLNLLVDPHLPEGREPRQLVANWGADRKAAVLVGERKWFSLPVGSGDWKGNRLWALPITIEFLDGRAVLFQEIALTDSPRGEVPPSAKP
jgi:hypothetical protein